MNPAAHVLVVEDEEIIASLIDHILHGDDVRTTLACDVESAWHALTGAERFDAVVLDRCLFDTDGMELLERIKESPALRHLPVIIETGLGKLDSVRQGLAAGAYYYLTKPLHPPLLLAVVHAAIRQCREFAEMQAALQEARSVMRYLDEGRFHCRSLAEARSLAVGLAASCPHPVRAAVGLQELLVNAVEHGNLGISYAEKTRLVIEDRWLAEIERRSLEPPYRDRRVSVILKRAPGTITFTIRDQGDGFAWQEYLELSPERAFDPHGRGIAIARMQSFDAMVYQGNGNTVSVTIADPDAQDGPAAPST